MSGTSTASGVLLAACVAVTLTAGAAAAHTGLVDSSPENSADLQQAPVQVRLLFREPVDPRRVALVVTGPDGRGRSAGQPSVTGAEVVQPLVQAAGDGTYRVAYRTVSTDGHPVQGEVVFRVVAQGQVGSARADGSGPAAPTAAAPVVAEGAGSAGAPWPAGAVAALATTWLVTWGYRARSNRGPGRD